MSEELKTHITFEKESDTSIRVLFDGNHVGNIFSQTGNGETPYPHDKHEQTLRSIQICGFRSASEVWSCGIFHGTKDVVLEFNPMKGEFYQNQKKEYQRYVEECFNLNRPEAIKSFDDWVKHMGYPDSYQIRRSVLI